MKIILASKSTVRQKLLTEMGLKFEIIPADIDEDKIREKTPSATVKKIAFLKAKKVFSELHCHSGKRSASRIRFWNRRSTPLQNDEELLIIAADTLVYLPKKRRLI